jgi:hypothetical protein
LLSKWRWAFIGYVGFCLAYLMLGNWFIRPPHLLTPTWVDNAIPFWPITLWVYLSQFALVFAPVLLCKDRQRLIETAWAAFITSMIGFSIFLLWPTYTVRPSVELYGLTKIGYRVMYSVNPPTNCIPSLHAALATIAAWSLSNIPWRKPIFVWAFLVVLSTLTTKQHYIAHILFGELVAAIGWLLASRWVHATVPEQAILPVTVSSEA